MGNDSRIRRVAIKATEAILQLDDGLLQNASDEELEEYTDLFPSAIERIKRNAKRTKEVRDLELHIRNIESALRLEEGICHRARARCRDLEAKAESTEAEVCGYIAEKLGIEGTFENRYRIVTHLKSVMRAAEACAIQGQANRERDATDPCSEEVETLRTTIEGMAKHIEALVDQHMLDVAAEKAIHECHTILSKANITEGGSLQNRIHRLRRHKERAENALSSITGRLNAWVYELNLPVAGMYDAMSHINNIVAMRKQSEEGE